MDNAKAYEFLFFGFIAAIGALVRGMVFARRRK
jgi:hypothetical protein